MSNPFNILNQNAVIEEITSLNGSETNEKIKNLLNAGQIVVLMKGNANMPMCGFSANTVAILKNLNKSFKTFNILNNEEIRQGVKSFSNWPTYPQIYFNGKLIGGNDIVTELYENGELQKMAESLS
jgi:monothiol glutaredoxin